MCASFRDLPTTVWAWHLPWHIFPREVLISLAQLSLASEDHFCPALFSGANATIQRFAAAQSAQGGSGRPSQCPTCCHSCLLLGCFRGASGWTSEPGEGVWGICREADPSGWVGARAAVGGNGMQVSCFSSLPLRPCGLRNAAHPLGP